MSLYVTAVNVVQWQVFYIYNLLMTITTTNCNPSSQILEKICITGQKAYQESKKLYR